MSLRLHVVSQYEATSGRIALKTFIGFLFVVGACASNNTGNSVPLIDGFDPPAPGTGEIQLIIPAIHGIAAGADTTQCTYLDYRAASTLDVIEYHGYQSSVGAHHMILYAIDNKEPAGTHECTEDDMINARYLAGGGADSPAQPLPDGIVLRLPADTQVMIQTHWINATDNVIDGQAAFNLKVEDTKPTNVAAQLFTVVTTMMTLDPGAGSAHADCVLKQDMSFFMMGGHAHEWATHITLTETPAGADPQMIYDTPWSKEYEFNPPRNGYTKDAPFVMHAGDKLAIDCTYNNTTGSTIYFPTEMCAAFGYFFPAVNEIDCTDGSWPTD